MEFTMSNRMADAIAKNALAKITSKMTQEEIAQLSVDTVLNEVIPFTERIETTIINEFQKIMDKLAQPEEGDGTWKLPVIDDLIE